MKKITRKAVLNELAAIAFSDYTRFAGISVDENGETVIVLTGTDKLPADCRKVISSVKAGTKGIEIKLYDKLRALELLGRVCGVFDGEDMGEKEALDKLKDIFERSDVFGSGTVSDS